MVRCNEFLCPNELVEKGELLICPECGSKYQWVYVQNTWAIKTIERSIRLLEKIQIRNLTVLEGLVKKL